MIDSETIDPTLAAAESIGSTMADIIGAYFNGPAGTHLAQAGSAPGECVDPTKIGAAGE